MRIEFKALYPPHNIPYELMNFLKIRVVQNAAIFAVNPTKPA